MIINYDLLLLVTTCFYFLLPNTLFTPFYSSKFLAALFCSPSTSVTSQVEMEDKIETPQLTMIDEVQDTSSQSEPLSLPATAGILQKVPSSK